ncbi:SpoIIE family protein phosphatase [Streptomyces sp. BV129]|uniref:ATP-binding SpoIIE family protein phosphatase n=1 Tax=Streptomyces sp. BV129 TaxID=2849671 RepID=UPI001C2F0DAB|nr:SpoIIE family protein phosphatase [Streptomyces sp. BV129]MBV1948494.1 SpoIIE family protein phosphatase [Streptomyces sp. BV129]
MEGDARRERTLETCPEAMRVACEALAVSPLAICVLDDELRVTDCNESAHRLLSGTDPTGQVLTDVLPLRDPEAETEHAREVRTSGVASLNRLVRTRQNLHGGSRTLSLSLFPMAPDQKGSGLICTIADVTPDEADDSGADPLRRLAAIQNEVGDTLDHDTTCTELAEALVPSAADTVVIALAEHLTQGEPPPLARHHLEPLCPIACSGAPGNGHVWPADQRPFAPLLAARAPRATDLVADTRWLDSEPAIERLLREAGAHALLAAPITRQGTVLGMLLLYRGETPAPFSREDIALVEKVCAHTARCLDHARSFHREHTIALAIQHSLLPRHPPTGAALDIADLRLPGEESGGGWFDVMPLSGARTGLAVGQVTGFGVRTATTMGELRTAGRSLATLDLQPGELLARLSRTTATLARDRSAAQRDEKTARTPLRAGCTYAEWDPLSCEVTVARAGGPEVVLVRPDRTVDTIATPEGPCLGGPAEPIPSVTAAVPPDSLLILHTPGLTDDPGAVPGLLRKALDRLPGSDGVDPRALCDELAALLTSHPRAIEAQVLVCRVMAFPGERVATLSLPDGPQAAEAARACCEQHLREWGLDEETRFNGQLIVSEFAGNAVRHGAPPARLRLIFDQALTIEVSDGGGNAPLLRHAQEGDEGGRGLFIVSQLADRWGTRYESGGGKTIWAEVDTAGGEEGSE